MTIKYYDELSKTDENSYLIPYCGNRGILFFVESAKDDKTQAMQDMYHFTRLTGITEVREPFRLVDYYMWAKNKHDAEAGNLSFLLLFCIRP